MHTNMTKVLAIPGYTDQSIWGYDDQMQSFFATVWADTTSGDADPDVWISGVTPVRTEEDLAAAIGRSVGLPGAEVLTYMHLWDNQEDEVPEENPGVSAEGNRTAWWRRFLGQG